MKVIVELQRTPGLEVAASAAFGLDEADLAAEVAPPADFALDPTFAPVPMPSLNVADRTNDAGHPEDRSFLAMPVFEVSGDSAPSTYIVRGELTETSIDQVRSAPNVVEVYSDPQILPAIICPGSPPMGTDLDVEGLVCATTLRGRGMDGGGVMVAIVDTGINVAHLQSKGKNPQLDVANSWTPQTGLVPGQAPVGHGTMCAFDVMIAAPNCTLLDVQLLRSTAGGPTPMSGLLSDGVRAYRHLIDMLEADHRPGESASLVVNNSWGMFDPNWDFAPGHPGNYSDNIGHPFNRIVTELELAGADILFAAGNCGPDCPDGRCRGITTNAIYGANGHPSVLCVAGVDISKSRVGYSSVGPARLSQQKPDVCGYTHFKGSGVYAADGGTSAATPVVAGVVAAIRSQRPYDPADAATFPAAVRGILTSTAEDLGPAGFDFAHGYGVVDGCALADKVKPAIDLPRPDICDRYPWLCEPWVPIDLCRIFPQLCRPCIPLPKPPPGPIPDPPPHLGGGRADTEALSGMSAALQAGIESTGLDAVEVSYLLGRLHASLHDSSGRGTGNVSTQAPGSGCGCG